MTAENYASIESIILVLFISVLDAHQSFLEEVLSLSCEGSHSLDEKYWVLCDQQKTLEVLYLINHPICQMMNVTLWSSKLGANGQDD